MRGREEEEEEGGLLLLLLLLLAAAHIDAIGCVVAVALTLPSAWLTRSNAVAAA